MGLVIKDGEIIKELVKRKAKYVHPKRDKYLEIDFTQNENDLKSFLKKVACHGGEDEAEDIAGGIKQMCKLNWQRPFRLAILITDAPCHGRAWNGEGIDDSYPDEDLSPCLDLIIQMNIRFLVFEFN